VQDRRFPGGRRLAALFGRHGSGWLARGSAQSSDPGQVPAAGWLGTSEAGLRRMRPAEPADVLAGLSGPDRQQLLASLDVEVAADALEVMAPGELTALLRDADPARAARLVAAMEPDEAVDALRRLRRGERAGLLEQMPPQTQLELARLLGYPGDQAGGIMTVVLACAHLGETVEQVRHRLAGQAGHRTEIDSVAVLDESGRLAGDVSVFDLLASDGGRPLADLIDPENPPVTLRPDAALDTVATKLMESRRSSLLVVDDEGRPLGRILSDDVLDTVVPRRRRLHFPRLLR
jgi:Mg/Co/Ni transporter MgtE